MQVYSRGLETHTSDPHYLRCRSTVWQEGHVVVWAVSWSVSGGHPRPRCF